MTKNTAISVEGVSKEFILPHQKKDTLKSFFLSPFSRYEKETQKALQDVSFNIEKGDFFGIVGRNGSGKSTLLKCLAGVYSPTTGDIEIHGKLIPFIELGVGFNPELSGRDNVFLNASILGFSRDETETMYQEIVDFSELHQHMDQKLKNYSSGMQVRLAFSIAIQAKGDILLLDEVLAVGDEAFQNKCYEYFNQLKYEKKTVILVSHSMPTIESYCNKALMLNEGKIELIGDTHKVATSYSKENFKRTKKEKNYKTSHDDIKTSITNQDGNKTDTFASGEELNMEISWKNPDVKHVGVALIKSDGTPVYATNTYIEKVKIKGKSITYALKLNLGVGEYIIKVGLFADNDQARVAFNDDAARIIINPNHEDFRWRGVTKLQSEWR